MTTEITEEMVAFVEQILKEVENLTIEYPYAVYIQPEGTNACQYTHGVLKRDGEDIPGLCGCLIGQAITRVYPECKPLLAKADLRTPIEGAEALIEDVIWQKFGVVFATSLRTPISRMRIMDASADPLERRLSALSALLADIQGEQDKGTDWRTCITNVRRDNELPPGLMLCQSYRAMLDQ